ncbi:MAG: hypothetical protein ABL864_06295 [Terricaulis sp.]
MRIAIISVLSSIALLGGCATAGMGHGRMSHEEMMRHCQMMEQHAAAAQPQGTPPASDAMGHGAMSHDGMSHDGMSHEQMMRHCEMMQRQQAAPAAAPPAAPLPH